MTNNVYSPPPHRSVVLLVYWVLLVAVTACGKSQLDTAKTAETAPVAQTPAQPEPVTESAEANREREAPSPLGPGASQGLAPAAPSPVQGAPARATSASDGSVRGAGSKATEGLPAAAKKSSAASRESADEQLPRAEPAFAEPPELAEALNQFESQLETLSTTRGCDEACRALESMRRTASRICELVVSGDPRGRCRTAKVRLEEASRDLAERCPSCK